LFTCLAFGLSSPGCLTDTEFSSWDWTALQCADLSQPGRVVFGSRDWGKIVHADIVKEWVAGPFVTKTEINASIEGDLTLWFSCPPTPGWEKTLVPLWRHTLGSPSQVLEMERIPSCFIRHGGEFALQGTGASVEALFLCWDNSNQHGCSAKSSMRV
jgi:hypothetical protein